MPPKEVRVQPKQVAQTEAGRLAGTVPNAAPPPGFGAAVYQANEAKIAAAKAQGLIGEPPPAPVDMLADDGKFLDADLAFGSAAQQAKAAELPAAVAGVEIVAMTPTVDTTAQIVESERQGMIVQPNTVGPVKAPSTRAEVSAQHSPLMQSQWPEITDVLQGRVPGQAVDNPVQLAPPKPPQLMPVQRVETIIKYESPPEEACYIFVRDWGGFLGDGAFKQFFKGDCVYDVYLIDLLKQGNCDAMQPHQIAKEFITCPSCSSSFPPAAARSLRETLK